jgi:hypothetical protein
MLKKGWFIPAFLLSKIFGVLPCTRLRQAGVIRLMSKKDIHEETKSETSLIIEMFEVIPV